MAKRKLTIPPEVYPLVKKVAIEGARDFVGAFVVVFGTQMAPGIDWADPMTWLSTCLIAGGKAGFRALGEYLRKQVGQGNYSSLVYKLPL